PCLDEECQDLLRQYDESGDPDVADHLIESLDAARQHRWEEATNRMDFTRSSRNSRALIRRLGAAQNPPKKNHPLSEQMQWPHTSSRLQKPLATKSLSDSSEISDDSFCVTPRTKP